MYISRLTSDEHSLYSSFAVLYVAHAGTSKSCARCRAHTGLSQRVPMACGVWTTTISCHSSLVPLNCEASAVSLRVDGVRDDFDLTRAQIYSSKVHPRQRCGRRILKGLHVSCLHQVHQLREFVFRFSTSSAYAHMAPCFLTEELT